MKVYVMSCSRKRAEDWARENIVYLQDFIIIQSWEDMRGLEGFNRVLHIIPGAYKLKDYSFILDYATEHGWTYRHVEG